MLLGWSLAWAGEETPVRGDKGERAWLAAPLLSYDSNLGLGGGAYGEYVEGDPTGTLPFQWRVAAQIFLTNGGYNHPYIEADFPAFLGTKLRWVVGAHYYGWTQAPYYGVGNDTRVSADAAEDAYWYDQDRWLLQNALRWRFRPSWQLYGIADVSAESALPYADTAFERDQPGGLTGRYVLLSAGILRDTRSDEIDPYDGSFLELALRGSHPWLGSDWTVGGVYAGASGWRLLGERTVMAGRALFDARTPGEALFQQSFLGGLNRPAVGGRMILRGLSEQRLRGDMVAGAQGELRFTFAQWQIRNTATRWALSPFMDVAQVWVWDEPLTADPHLTGGLGLRIVLNGLLVLRADTALAMERYEDGSAQPQVQFYALSDHPF